MPASGNSGLRAAGRRSGWRAVAFALYLLVFILPNLLVALIYPDRADILKFLLSCAMVAIWHAAFARPRVAVLCSLPFFLLLPMVLFFISIYHEPPTMNAFAIALQTNAQESSDYLSVRLFPVLSFWGLAIGAWAIGYWAAGAGWRGLFLLRERCA